MIYISASLQGHVRTVTIYYPIIFEIPKYMKISKIIHIRTRNKTVPVSLVSIRCSKDREETTVPIRMEKEKYYVSSLLTSLYNNDVHTKQIHKRITNKTVPISIVFYGVFKK